MIFKFLPELINLIKWIAGQVEKGTDILAVKKTIANIDKAFTYADKIDEFDAQATAGELDEIFTGIELNDLKPDKLQGSRTDI